MRMRMSQPSPYGSSLTISGSSTAFWFTSSTSPDSGEIDVRDGLDRLDLAVGRVLRDGRADLGRLEVDELAERVLREPGDAERASSPSIRAQSCSGWYFSSSG